jgi:Tol biopolymer transport system component
VALSRLAPLFVLFAMLLATACGGGGEEATPTQTGTPALGSAIPMGKIAFVSLRDGNAEIYVITRAGGEVNITNDPDEDVDPAWSPDGKEIAWSSKREGTYNIYVANADGSAMKRLTASDAADLSPRWSPDGKRIAFSRQGALMLMNSDGTGVTQINQPEPEATAPPCEGGGFLGGWSPDSDKLTFYTASGTRGTAEVCTVNVDGSQLTVVRGDPDTYNTEPAWSPKDQRIVYRSIRQGNHEIYLVDADGSNDANLTNNPAIDIEPAWSPDGQWIVFSSNRTYDFDLFIMKADGSGLRQLTRTYGKDSNPSWGPD